MLPVSVTPRLSMTVLSQVAAQARPPEQSAALLSITGIGWEPFRSIHEDGYSKGVMRIVMNDVAAGMSVEAITTLQRDIAEAISMVQRLDGGEQSVFFVIHCHAGMSRSNAFAVGCAATVALENIDVIISAIRDGVVADGREFIPNPLVLSEFEKALGLEEGTLSRPCAMVSPQFRTWVKYWSRRTTIVALGALCMLVSSHAFAQDVRSPSDIERGLTTHSLVPCGRESKPPPDGGLDINSASEEALSALPGMDTVTATRIVRGRPYGRAGDVMERGIITSTTFDLSRSYLWVMRASLNSSTPKELTARLGISDEKATKITSKRPWNNVDDLVFQGILSMSDLDRLRPLISLR